MSSKVTKDLARKSFDGLVGSLKNQSALSPIAAKFSKMAVEASTQRRRVVLLDLNEPDELKLWQTLHNTPERFDVLSEKESHQKGEYLVRIIFLEKGENLPVTKTKIEFFNEYL